MEFRVNGRQDLLGIPWPEVPRFESPTLAGSKVSTPKWMVKVGEETATEMTGDGGDSGQLSAYCELFGWLDDTSRDTTGNLVNDLFTSSSVQLANPTIIIPNGEWGPKLEKKLYAGNIIENISLVRLGNFGEELNVVIQEIIFGGCTMSRMKQEGDELWLQFIARTRTNKFKKYKQDETAEGQVVSYFDFVGASIDGGGGGEGGGGGA